MVKTKCFFIHIFIIIIAIGFCVFIRYGLKYVMVNGCSMEPTLTEGMVLKYEVPEAEISRGEIILFKDPETEKTLIKRVVGLPGDVVSIVNGQFYINGIPFCEYDFGDIADAGILGNNVTLLLNKEEYFCMGDNYGNSRDSRTFGPIKKNWITGIVLK